MAACRGMVCVLHAVHSAHHVYFNVNFNVFIKLIKVHLLVSELYIHQNAQCNNKKPIVNVDARGIGCSLLCLGHFTPMKHHATHCTGGWVGLGAGLDGCR